MGILKVACDASADRWNNTAEILSAGELSTYCRASTLVIPLLPIPDLTSSWLSTLKVFRDHLEAYKSKKVLNPDALRKWVDLIKAIAGNEPRFLRQVVFPNNYVADLVKLIEFAQKESENTIVFDTYEDLRDEATRLSSISELLTNLAEFFPKYTELLEEVTEQLDNSAESLKEEADKLAEDENEDDYNWHRESRQEFDIDALFADL